MTSAVNVSACQGCGDGLPTGSKDRRVNLLARQHQSCVPCYDKKLAKGPETTTVKAVPVPKPKLTIVPTVDQVVKPGAVAPKRKRATLEEVHDVFVRWLGKEYDLTALDATLAAAAVEQLDGDPVWLLLVSGSGNAKTETVGALSGAGANVTSTITSEGALLSASSTKEKAKDATGGLLRKIGDRGLLVIKDVTSILSMNRDLRTSVLAALREVYDGRWERNVGTDGGRTLTWVGRIVLIGAVTTAYDAAHGVIAAMGDRFALIRMDSTVGRVLAGRQALANVGSEIQMRKELSEAAGALLAHVDTDVKLSDEDVEILLRAADLVTLSRTAVERDYRGTPLEAHAPEMPTRFAKMLGQILRGGMALGMSREYARSVSLRVARDSMPPRRAQILLDVAGHPVTPCRDVVKRVQLPRDTVDRTLQELHLIGLLQVSDSDTQAAGWHYRLAEDVDEALVRGLLSASQDGPKVDHAAQKCHQQGTLETTLGIHPSLYPNTPDTDKSAQHDQLLLQVTGEQAEIEDQPKCIKCGQKLLLVRPGRNTCARCEPTEKN